MTSRLALLCVVLAAAGCKKKAKRADPPPLEPVPVEAMPEPAEPNVDEPEPGFAERARPLPAQDPDGLIGVGLTDDVALIDAADDGSWVALCARPDRDPRPRLVVGDGAALPIDRLIATSRRDLIVAADHQLHHVDVPARTVRALGPVAPAAIDGETRRLVYARGERLVVQDPGMPLRLVNAGLPVAALWLEHRRVATVAGGEISDLLRPGCDPVRYRTDIDRVGVDLDPTGVEAIERIGPELEVTAEGEIKLDGVVVIDAACGAHVLATLAEPPRVLAACRKGDDRVVGPGLKRTVRGYLAHVEGTGATISEQLVVGERLVCMKSTCVDLLTGTSYPGGDRHIWHGPLMLVTGDDAGLRIEHLPATIDDAPRTLTVALPRQVQTVTVDSATGRRRTGPAPVPPKFIDAAGRWLLYGRHVIDLQEGVRTTTLGEDALAIDARGRVLVRTSPGAAQLRWRTPS